MMKLTLIATTIMGLEAVLKREILALGFDTLTVYDTRVEFEAELKDIPRVNLWLRTAGRVYVRIAQFKATSFDELFDKTLSLNWGDWIQKEDQFPIAKVSSRKSTLFSKSDCQSIVKKAIVENLRAVYGTSHLAETKALLPIRIQIESDIVTLSIDTSGKGLNKRGYRAHMDRAPLRETLAAGLVLLSRWRPDRERLLDPLCGSATICIEAGLIAQNKAPGINRSFNSQEWSILDVDLWDQAIDEACDLERKADPDLIIASDYNPRALDIAKKNIDLSEVTCIKTQQIEFKNIQAPSEEGTIVTNPPYGQRLSDQKESDQLYKQMGKLFKSRFKDWSYHILTLSESFEDTFQKRSTKHRKLYNGGMKCWLYQYV